MPPRPTIAVLIACHNRRAKTLACLASLAGQDAAADLHPIIFDDASEDGTADAVRAQFQDAEILIGDGQAFWAGGMRAAFSHALARGYNFYLWLNDDVVLEPWAISKLLATHATLPDSERALSLIGGAVRDPISGQPAYGGIAFRNRVNRLRFVRVAPDPQNARICDTLNGNVVLLPRSTAETIGGLGAAYLHTLGDLDYGLRVKHAGGWVGLAPGYVGTCAPNRLGARWLNPDLPLGARWRLVASPLGLPLRPWLHFARSHGGPFWPVFAGLAYWRLFVPAALARVLGRRRDARAEERRVDAAA